MGGASWRGMHPIVFHFKRTHLRCVALFGKELRKIEMTCARVDVMHALDRSYRGLLTQSQIARELGVCRQTIAEMVDRMERRGLVRKLWWSCRTVLVQLTDKGRRCIQEARHILRFERVHYTLRACFSHRAEAERRSISLLKWDIRAIAQGLGDRSTYGDSIDECFHPKPPVGGQVTLPGDDDRPLPPPAMHWVDGYGYVNLAAILAWESSAT